MLDRSGRKLSDDREREAGESAERHAKRGRRGSPSLCEWRGRLGAAKKEKLLGDEWEM